MKLKAESRDGRHQIQWRSSFVSRDNVSTHSCRLIAPDLVFHYITEVFEADHVWPRPVSSLPVLNGANTYLTKEAPARCFRLNFRARFQYRA